MTLEGATSGYRGNNHNGKARKKNSGKEEFVQRYTHCEFLAEAVIIDNKAYFAVVLPTQVGEPDNGVSIILQESISYDTSSDGLIKPLDSRSYINKPYTFKSKEEFDRLVEIARNITLDTLYRKVKSIWKKYVDADDFHISICTADTIFTYFQDKIGLTHYLFFVGGNGSGKSNNLTIFAFLAYRNMTSSDITSANIYQSLGSGEEGLGTICEDEADDIDEDYDKMRVYKNGYITGRPVLRTDTSTGRRQLKLNTFCFKAFAAEKLPDSTRAKGFNDRVIELPCMYGFPQYDISEIINSAGDNEFQELLDELLELRNTLLIYRLLHFSDKIPNVKLNIVNREQLFKPVIRIFQNTKTLDELLRVVSKYVGEKRERKTNTLHALLYRTVTELINEQNTYELESSLVWDTALSRLEGRHIPNKPQSFESVEYGTISQKDVTQILIEVFGATRSKRHGGTRKLVFHPSKLEKLARMYHLNVKIEVMVSGTHGTHGTLVGLDRHLEEQSNAEESAQFLKENSYIDMSTTENSNRTTLDKLGVDSGPSTEVSQVSQIAKDRSSDIFVKEQDTASKTVTGTSSILASLNHLKNNKNKSEIKQERNARDFNFYSGKWYCKYCNFSGDKFDVQDHYC
jgi:hypothetical protein